MGSGDAAFRRAGSGRMSKGRPTDRNVHPSREAGISALGR